MRSCVSEESDLQNSADFRSQMPVVESFAYFDHAAVAPLPSRTAASMQAYVQEASQNGDAIWPKWASKVKQLRQSCANLLNASHREIALLNSTTQGINLVAEGMPWEIGDNVVVPANEFPSNMVPWRNLERRGVETRVVEVPEDGNLGPETFRPFLDERTRLIALSWVGYSSGYRVDVSKIVELAHANRGTSGPTLVALDAIQGLGAFPLNCGETGVDFLCADGHKWLLGPEGAGLFFIREEHLNLLVPLGLGWNSLAFDSFQPLKTEDMLSKIKTDASRYEGGTTNMAGMHGLSASVELLLESGTNRQPSNVANAILANVGLLTQELTHHELQVRLPDTDENRSGILGVTWPAALEDPTQLDAARRFLLAENVVTSVRGGCLRVSTHAYNNAEDVERLVSGLVSFIGGKKT